MNKTLRLWLLAAAATTWSCANADQAADEGVALSREALRTSDFTFDVTLQQTGRSTIHAVEYSDRRRPLGLTVLALHGLAETGPTFRPLADAVFADLQLRRQVGRIIVISLPGHGASPFPSSLPAGKQFGQLLIEDNVSVLLQAIAALHARGTPAQILIGHSMGGLAVTAAQAELKTQNSSLRAKGVELAILFAPVPPHGQPWTQPPPADLTMFVVPDPKQGAYLALSDAVWLGQAFSTRAGKLVPNAPTPEDIAKYGYIGYEPIATLTQLLEAPATLPDGSTLTIPRPSVPERAFDPQLGTRLAIVSFSEDVLVAPADLESLYVYLTGDTTKQHYHPVVADDAVHSQYISNPQGLLDAVLD